MLMKQTALIASLLVLGTANAGAYENPAAGFSVKDKQPFYKMESSKLYAFTSFGAQDFAKLEKKARGSIHIVNYYTPAEMSSVIGSVFSDAYFIDEYEKLALLQRSKLDMRTVPTPLLDLKKYAALKGKEAAFWQEDMLKQQLGRVEPSLRIDKVGPYKLITQSYLYKQGQILNEIDISLLAANEQLYMLTSVTSDSKYYEADKTETKTAEAAKIDFAVTAVKPETLPKEVRQQLWQEHLKFVKGFKAMQPQTVTKALQYVDAYADKTVQLPDDWVYGQLQIREKDAKGCLTMAAPIENLRKIFAELDYVGLYRGLSTATATKELPTQTVQDEGRKVLQSFDALLMSLSYQSKDKDFPDMVEAALSNKIFAEAMLAEALQALKHRGGENFVLQSYSYDLNYANDKAGANIKARTRLWQKLVLDNELQLTLAKDRGSLIFYTHKPAYETAAVLEKSLREWQF